MSELGSEVKNLDLLLRAAKAVVESVKSHKTVLGMHTWNDYGEEARRGTPARADVEKNYCGTSACFAGHMPFLGIPELAAQEGDYDRFGDLSYCKYLGRLFGLPNSTYPFSWFFSPGMSNDVDLLLARVEYYCEHLSAPSSEEWPAWGWGWR